MKSYVFCNEDRLKVLSSTFKNEKCCFKLASNLCFSAFLYNTYAKQIRKYLLVITILQIVNSSQHQFVHCVVHYCIHYCSWDDTSAFVLRSWIWCGAANFSKIKCFWHVATFTTNNFWWKRYPFIANDHLLWKIFSLNFVLLMVFPSFAFHQKFLQ